jgi:hypothetical protein
MKKNWEKFAKVFDDRPPVYPSVEKKMIIFNNVSYQKYQM